MIIALIILLALFLISYYVISAAIKSISPLLALGIAIAVLVYLSMKVKMFKNLLHKRK